MARITKKQAMFNTLLCNVIVAESDFQDGKISVETLKVVYKQTNSFIMVHMSDEFWREFREYHTVVKVKAIVDLI